VSNPDLVTNKDCEAFLFERGKGWVCEVINEIVGFAIADLKENNIWALFINPNFEGKGIGTKLQKIMLDWYFENGKEDVWLGTSPTTRAEKFYSKSGWVKNGMHGSKEVKFELSKKQWENSKHSG
jgi:GNAT superfamily N-acetyltransferase